MPFRSCRHWSVAQPKVDCLRYPMNSMGTASTMRLTRRLILTRGTLVFTAAWPAFAATDVVVRCEGDVTDALQAAVTAGARDGNSVVLQAPAPDATCTLAPGLKIPAGIGLLGADQPVLKLTRSGQAFAGDEQSGGFLISGLTLDGSDTPVTSIIALR